LLFNGAVSTDQVEQHKTNFREMYAQKDV